MTNKSGKEDRVQNLFDDLCMVHPEEVARKELYEILIQQKDDYYGITGNDIEQIKLECQRVENRITLHQKIGASNIFGIIPPEEGYSK